MIRRLLVTVTAAVAVVMSPYAVAVMAVAAAEPVAERAPVAQHVHHHTPGMVMGVSGAPVAIDMLDNSFGPAALTVAPGTTVTWTNRGARFHTITASSPPGAFDSGYVAPAASWSFTFASVGTFVYHCEIHTGMAGTITVVSATATPAPVGPAVDIQDNVFSPASLSVAPGTTVTWTNRGAVPHAVSAEGLLSSGRLAPGDSFAFTFTTAGVYAYVCDIHAGMAGTVTVGTATTPAPTPTPTPTPPPPPAGGANVDATDDTFTPATLTIAPGTTVTWTNRGSRRHTVTRTGQFDSGLLSTGQTFSFTFTTAGTYAYVCDLHAPAMAGSIVVTGTPPAATPTPTLTPTPTPAVTPAPTPTPAGAVAVTVGDNVFSPSAITVTPGTTVVWTNRGVRPHTVTGVGPGSGLLASGQSYSVRFDTVGGFLYVCDLHGGMTGTVVVGAAGAPAPPPPPPPSTPAPPPVPSGATRITVVDDEFQPATITVTAGTTVTWASQGRTPHTITAKDGSFDVTIARGSTFTHVFHRPGTYPYRCDFHPGMTGTVVVTGTASASPSQSPTPTPTLAPTPAPPPPPGAITVSMRDNVFEPRVASVRTGTTVVWRNNGTLRHTATSSDGLFDSDLLRSGEAFSTTFTRPGTFAYVCAIHSGMSGVVEVTGAATDGALTTSATARPTQSSTPSATPIAPPAAAPTVTITAGDNFFDPKDLEVVIGTAVTWTNRGVLKHTVTFADGATSEILATGQTYSRTFTAAGTHPYLCALHPEMTGTIRVVAPLSPTPALGSTATATPSPPGSATPGGVRASDPGPGALRGDWPMGMLLGAVLALIAFIGIAGPLALVFLQDARRPPMKT